MLIRLYVVWLLKMNLLKITAFLVSEPPISRSDLYRVEPGVTTKEWVLDTFGLPTRKKHLKDYSEILIYERSEKKEYEFSLFLLFRIESSEVKKETVSFIIKDGVVRKYWQD